MQEKDKRYIRENVGKKPLREIAGALGVKERKIRKFLEKENIRIGGAVPASGPSRSSAAPTRHSFPLWMILILVLAGVAIYSNTFQSPFLLDDEVSIAENPAIKHLGELRQIWGFWPTRFVTYFSFALNYHLNGLRVFGYHVFNLLVHLGSALLVWFIGLLTFSTPALRQEKIARHGRFIAFFAALIFVAHPVQTQAVTYIVQRAASLATFFYLASLAFYIKARLLQEGRGPAAKFHCGGFVSMALLAMFSKEMAITLPLMVILYEFFFFRTQGKPFNRRLVLLLLLLAVIPLTMLLSHSVDFGEMRRRAEAAPEMSSLQYLFTQFRVLLTYARLLVLPINQNLDYDYPVAQSLFQPSVLLGLAFFAGLVFAAVKLFRRHRLVSFGICWFLLALLPESSIIPIRDVIFEHRLYLPMAGFCLFLAGGLYALFGEKHDKPLSVVLALLVVCYGGLAYVRNAVWKDDVMLWSDTVRKSPAKSRPYNNRGLAYERKGELELAMADYDKAIALDPGMSDTYNNRGNIYQIKGDLAAAMADFNKALVLKPTYPEAYNNRGNIYQAQADLERALADYNKAIEIRPDAPLPFNNRGYIYQARGDFDRALADYDKALMLDPDYVDAYNNRGNLYQSKGDVERAMADYNKAMSLKGNTAMTYNNRGNAYAQAGDTERALADFNRALAMDPRDAETYNSRGSLYQNRGDLDLALADYDKAIENAPRHQYAYYNRAMAYARRGDLDRALADYDKAIEISPGLADAYNNRGNVYQARGELNKALADFTKAIEIDARHADAYNNRGNVHQALGEFDQALTDYDKAIALRPRDAKAYNNRGYVYSSKGQARKALEDYAKAIEINPDYAQAYKNRAVVLLDQGEYAKSREDLRRAEALGAKADPKFVAELEQALGAAGATQ